MITDDITYEYRSGIGTDLHRLVPQRKLMLCGIYVPHHLGPLAHSDGDVAIHAIIDAILGAAGMGDIGTMFPDSDPAFAGIDSKALLVAVKDQIEEKKWEIVNVDVTIHAQAPKLAPFKGQMKRCVASLLGIDFAAMNVKAKTAEGLGAVGREEAIEAYAIVLLRRRLKRTL